MKYSQEEIVNALKIIKDTCKEKMHGVYACYDCPLSKNNTCVLQEQSPEEWDINTNPPTIWKAFK